MSTLAEFSYEVGDAFATAQSTVGHNREHRTSDIDSDQRTVMGADGREWNVAWVFRPSNGVAVACWWSPAKRWVTHNGVEITPNLRVFTNDWVWGTVVPEQFEGNGLCEPGGQYFDGWFSVRLDSGAVKIYDGQRMTTSPPK